MFEKLKSLIDSIDFNGLVINKKYSYFFIKKDNKMRKRDKATNAKRKEHKKSTWTEKKTVREKKFVQQLGWPLFSTWVAALSKKQQHFYYFYSIEMKKN